MRFLTGLLIFGALSAQNYQTIASNAQLMKGVQKPSMDALAAMSKAGGPKDDAEWAQAEQAAALLAETTQILLMGDRPKDQDVWVKSANRVLTAAKASAVAAKAKDLEAWKPTLGQMGGGCRGCHDVHRPKKQ